MLDVFFQHSTISFRSIEGFYIGGVYFSMDEILFSIIIPVYKTEKYLNRSLKSALNQTEKKIEIIVVNDGSPGEECDNIVGSVHDDRLLYIKKEINEGLFLARKTGISKASGKFIIHLDADDELKLNACEVLHIELDKNPEYNTADYITYRYEVYTNNIKYERSLDQIGNTMDDIITFKKSHMVWAKAYSTSFVKKIYEEMPNFYLVHFEDYYQEVIIQYWAKNRYCVNQILYMHYDDIGVSQKRLYNNIDTVKKIDRSAQNILFYLKRFFADKDDKYYSQVETFIFNFYIGMLAYVYDIEIITLIYNRIGMEKFIFSSYIEMKKELVALQDEVTTLNYLRSFAKLCKPIITILRVMKAWLMKNK